MTTLQLVQIEMIALRGGVEITIHELRAGLNAADLRGFEIRTSTGYKAVFLEAHTECDREPCVKANCWASHSPAKCHGLHHIEQIRALAKEVAKTYGSGKRGPTNTGSTRIPPRGWTGKRVPNVSTSEWASGDWAKTMESVVSP
jgi:hypothetical protein